jgi:hypothetical protein
MGNKMNEGMLMPYKKILDDIDKKNSELESKLNEIDSTLRSKGVI